MYSYPTLIKPCLLRRECEVMGKPLLKGHLSPGPKAMDGIQEGRSHRFVCLHNAIH